MLKGRLQRLAAPKLAVRGDARLADRVLDGTLSLSSPALRGVARGGIDLGTNRYRKLSLGIDLLRPPALFPNMRGRNVRMVWTLDGPFGRADYAYRLTAPAMAFDATGFVDVRAEGRGRMTAWPMRVPLRLSAPDHRGRRRAGRFWPMPARRLLTITPKLVAARGAADQQQL